MQHTRRRRASSLRPEISLRLKNEWMYTCDALHFTTKKSEKYTIFSLKAEFVHYFCSQSMHVSGSSISKSNINYYQIFFKGFDNFMNTKIVSWLTYHLYCLANLLYLKPWKLSKHYCSLAIKHMAWCAIYLIQKIDRHWTKCNLGNDMNIPDIRRYKIRSGATISLV